MTVTDEDRDVWGLRFVDHYAVDVNGRIWPINCAGKIPFRQSAVYTLTAWANDCERKLLNLHCGQMLERSRHRAWAERLIPPST